MKRLIALSAIALLDACSPEPSPPAERAEPPVPAELRNEPQREIILGSDGQPAAFAPHSFRKPHDMIAGCEGSMLTFRPRGSNCSGIYPEQCGADRAARHRGELLTEVLRKVLLAYSPSADVRFYHRGEGMDADLRVGRLNVELDSGQRIIAADCF